MKTSSQRPAIEKLACVNPECALYSKAGKGNLTIRKIYGVDQIRYLRCHHCGQEFSERKQTALWNCKIPESRAIRVGKQLGEGTSIKGTARLTETHPDTVRRLALKFGTQAQGFHDQMAQELSVKALEMDERHGYAQSKAQQQWDAVTLDPKSKFIVQIEVGPRNEALIEQLMSQSVQRLKHPHDLVLMTDGEASYRTLFPKLFGIPYNPPVKVQSVVSPRLDTAFPAPWLMFKSSSTVKAESLKLSRSTRLMVVGHVSSKP